jgi:hypothetical protein
MRLVLHRALIARISLKSNEGDQLWNVGKAMHGSRADDELKHELRDTVPGSAPADDAPDVP